jgi:RimJ/RimL family protein N-acetyltransferase
MPEVAYFRHGNLCLRPVVAGDLDRVRDLRNDGSTWIHLTDPRAVSPSDQAAWFEGVGSKSGKFYFVVFDDLHPFVGIVRLDEYDPQNRSIRVGADVVPDLRGQGYGKAIYEAVQKYCFDMLNCHRIWLLVLDTNVVAKRLYGLMGFVREGIMRQAIFREGQYVDYHVMSILEDEYRKPLIS